MNRSTIRRTASQRLHVGMMLHHVTSRWHRRANEALSEVRLNHTHYIVLWGVWALDADHVQPTQVELSVFTGADVMLISKAVRSLEADGLVERRRDVRDTRARVVVLTNKGRAVVQRAEEIMSDLETSFFPVEQTTSLKSHLLELLEP